MLIKVKLAGRGGGKREGGSKERREQSTEGGRVAGWQTHWHSAIQSVATPHLHVIARVAGQRSPASCIQASPNKAAREATQSRQPWTQEDTLGFLLAPESPPMAPTGPPPSAPPSSTSCAVEPAQQKTKAAISATLETAREEEQPCPFASSASVEAPGHPTQLQRAKCQQLPSSKHRFFALPTKVHFKLALKRQRTQICTKAANIDGKTPLSLRCAIFSDDNDQLTV